MPILLAAAGTRAATAALSVLTGAATAASLVPVALLAREPVAAALGEE